MSSDMLQDKLKQLRENVRQRWGVLTVNDLATIDGKLDKLPGLLQEKYGYTKEQAEKEIKLFRSDLQAKGTNILEVVLDTLTNETLEEETHVK